MSTTEVTLEQVLAEAPDNFVILDALERCFEVVRDHKKIMCSVSGGADSDVMIDMIIRCGGKDKTVFVFFDTGLEYAATREHLLCIESKYDIEIVRQPPVKPIPLSCKEYGVPFWSKDISTKLYYLQSHGFRFEDEPFEVLMERYPGCKGGLSWWCNTRPGERFNIVHTPFLKEFMIQNPPKFKFSAKCCDYAKKIPSHRFEKANGFDLVCVGVRKAEGGARSTAYKSCFTSNDDGIDRFRPVFWLRDKDKDEYCRHYEIVHSKCYTKYGLKRTGCFGCPFAKDIEQELEVVSEHEPRLFKAANNIFGESYEYTRQYLRFREEMKAGR